MAFSIPQVNSCCGCTTLQTGAKIFALMSIVGCILLVILSGWEISMLRKHAPEESGGYVVLLAVDIIVQLVQAGTSVLLLQAAYQEKAKSIVPWLVTTMVVAVLEVVFMPSLLSRVFITLADPLAFDWMLTTAFFLVDDIYGLLVVYSYYRTLAP